jgi:thymidine kinase
MSVSLYLGPMCSGKTTKLLELYKVNIENGKSCLMITPEIDSRTKTGHWTHDNKTFDGNVIWTNYIITENVISEIDKYDVILINEGQFISDIYDGVLTLVENMKKVVIIGGLDGDFERKPFENISRIIPLCDTIEKLRANCEVCGKPASFSKKLGGTMNKVEIGGKNLYEPRCREHFH